MLFTAAAIILNELPPFVLPHDRHSLGPSSVAAVTRYECPVGMCIYDTAVITNAVLS
jgi:hypothetical protein